MVLIDFRDGTFDVTTRCSATGIGYGRGYGSDHMLDLSCLRESDGIGHIFGARCSTCELEEESS